MKITPKNILVVYQYHGDKAQLRTSEKIHIHCMETSNTPHTITYYNTADDAPTWYGQNKSSKAPDWIQRSKFDVIVFFNSLVGYRTSGPLFYEWKKHVDWFRDIDCLKIAVTQDDYDCAGILDEWLFDWGVSAVITALKDHKKTLYPIMHDKARFYQCFTGYIHDETARRFAHTLLPICERKTDLFYRARKLMYYLGSHGQMKHKIAEIVGKRAGTLGYNCDISTRIEDVIFGDAWFDRLAASKAVFGCKGGASAINLFNEARIIETTLKRKNPELSFDEFDKHMPPDWDSHMFSALSPRHFECVITKTCQILIEDDYDGAFEAENHYIPLKPDFSNLDEALEKLRDYQYIQEMVDSAYRDVYVNGNYTYRAFAELIETAILDYERNSLHNHTGEISAMTAETDKSLETLERRLISEHHENLRLEANMEQVMFESGKLQCQLSEAQAKIGILVKEKEVLYAGGEKYRSLRNKLFIMMFFVIAMATCMIICFSGAIIYLVK